MTYEELNLLWEEFNERLRYPLGKPRLRVGPIHDHPGQRGKYSAGMVTIVPEVVGDMVPFHEFAHYLADVMPIYHGSLLGARFLAAARLGAWDEKARELFANCFVWLLTGKWKKGWPRSKKGAEVIRVLLHY